MTIDTIDDPTIKIKPNLELIDFITKHVKKTNNIPSVFAKINKTKSDDTWLKLMDIIWLNNFLKDYRKKSGKNIYLHELLNNDDIVLPTPKVIPRNPELEARIQKLQAQQNAREYAAMTKSVDSVRTRLPEDTIAYQMKVINKQLIAVAQFIFSVVAAFTFGFIGVELIIGQLDFGFRLLLGIICGLIVALAEIYFLAMKLNEDCFDSTAAPVSQKPHQE